MHARCAIVVGIMCLVFADAAWASGPKSSTPHAAPAHPATGAPAKPPAPKDQAAPSPGTEPKGTQPPAKDSHGAKPSDTAEAHGGAHATAAKAVPANTAKAVVNPLDAAASRISERITELKASTDKKSTPAATPPKPAAPAKPPSPPRVELVWRTEVTWPAELLAPSAADQTGKPKPAIAWPTVE